MVFVRSTLNQELEPWGHYHYTTKGLEDFQLQCLAIDVHERGTVSGGRSKSIGWQNALAACEQLP